MMMKLHHGANLTCLCPTNIPLTFPMHELVQVSFTSCNNTNPYHFRCQHLLYMHHPLYKIVAPWVPIKSFLSHLNIILNSSAQEKDCAHPPYPRLS